MLLLDHGNTRYDWQSPCLQLTTQASLNNKLLFNARLFSTTVPSVLLKTTLPKKWWLRSCGRISLCRLALSGYKSNIQILAGAGLPHQRTNQRPTTSHLSWMSPGNFSGHLLFEHKFTEWLSAISSQWQRLTGACMKLQHLVERKMTLPPVPRVASCMHQILWKLLYFVTVYEDFKNKYGQRRESRKSEGISLRCLFEQFPYEWEEGKTIICRILVWPLISMWVYVCF